MPPKKNYRKLAHEMLAKQMDRLDRFERREMTMMAKQWSMLAGTVNGLIDELLSRGKLSPNQVVMLDTYVKFRNELAMLNVQYAKYNATLISAGQMEFGMSGIESAQEMLNLSAKFYNKIPIAAVERMVGATSTGAPLNNLLILRYGENAERASRILVESMALGRNPLESARLIGATLEGSISDTIRIARTEQIAILREMQTASYQESGLVTGVDLVAEPDACEICLGFVDENPHELGYVVDTHPNCRCALAPVLGD